MRDKMLIVIYSTAKQHNLKKSLWKVLFSIDELDGDLD